MDLVEFLRARLDEERAEVAALHKGCMERWYSAQELFKGWGPLDWDEAEHIATYGPGRMLAEVDAKRQLIDERADAVDLPGDPGDDEPEYAYGYARALDDALRLLALPYAGHPDYRQEWRPQSTNCV
jgi:hypothetical protein